MPAARPDAPFEPRLRWQAVWRDIRRGRAGDGGWSRLPALAMFGVTVFCFAKVFQTLSLVEPLDPTTGANHGNAIGFGMRASIWLVAAAFSAGGLGVALDARWAPKVGLKEGALREMAAEAARRVLAFARRKWAAWRARADKARA